MQTSTEAMPDRLPAGSEPDADYEVLIVGGGAAGLTAALTFGRLQRRVLVCDNQRPRNQPAAHMHNFPGFDGQSPESWRRQVRTEIAAYPSVRLTADTVLTLEAASGSFVARLASGGQLRAARVLLAYGMRDQLPDIDQLPALWGRTAVHCPFCHGFEFRDRPLGVIGDGDQVLHLVAMLLGLSQDVLLFSNGPSRLSQAGRNKLAGRGLELIETPIATLRHQAGQLEAVVLADGRQIPRTALYVAPRFPVRLSADLGEILGCARTEFGWYAVDENGQTSVPGVYAAGDIAGLHGQTVLMSAAFGSLAAARISAELLMQQAEF